MTQSSTSQMVSDANRTILTYVTPFTIVTCVVILTLAHYSFNRWETSKREKAFAVQHGSQDPTWQITTYLPLNLDYIYKHLKAGSRRRLLSHFKDLYQKYGHTFYMAFVDGTREFNTIDPENVEALLNTHFSDFWLGSNRVDNFKRFFGSGIFTQDGPAWKHSRSLLRPQFMHNRTFYFMHIQEQARRLSASLHREAGRQNSLLVDLEPLFYRYTLDTTTAMLFGKPISAYDDQKAVSDFVTGFTVGQIELITRFRLRIFRVFAPGARLREATRLCHAFVDGIVSDARKCQKHSRSISEETDEHDNLLDSLLHLYPYDDVAVRSQLLNILLAGRDTTACLLTWCFRLLALHPVALNCLYHEIAKFPDLADLDRRTLHVSHAPYLNAVLKETLRLYPSVPTNTRVALNTTILPHGGGPDGNSPILIRKGDTVAYAAYLMHRRKDIWGQDADQFRPERWLENDGELEKRNALAYIPFNAGPRVCLGQDMATLEAATAVVHILKSWNGGLKFMTEPHLGEHGETGKEEQLCAIMVRPVDGCHVTLSRI